MEDYNRMHDMTSRDYIGVLFRHRGVILTTIMTVVTIVIAVVLLRTHVFQSEVKMLISGQKQAQAEYYTDIGIDGFRSAHITLTQSEIVTSDPVIERAVSVLGLAKKPLDYENRFCSRLKKPIVRLRALATEKKLKNLSKDQQEALLFRLAMEDLRQRLKVEPVRDTDIFLIKVKDYNPLGSAVTANVVSRSYMIFDLEQQLAEMQLKYGEKNLSVTQLKEAIEKMTRGLNGAPLPALEAIGPATVKIIEQAKVPLKPAGIPRGLVIILAFVMSVFLGVLLAFIFESMDQTFKSPREMESFLGIDFLGSLPRKATNDDYRNLAEQLYLIIKDKGTKSLLFTSALSQDGVTSIISNLGTLFAENFHQRILLIDANLRNPALHKMFKLPAAEDMINIIEGSIPFEKGIRSVKQNLHILVTGPSALNPITVLESHMMKGLMQQAKDQYDVVLIDSAPLGKVKDATVLSAFTDGVILVANERKTRRQVVKDTLDSMKARKANILGGILNDRTFAIPKVIYDRI